MAGKGRRGKQRLPAYRRLRPVEGAALAMGAPPRPAPRPSVGGSAPPSAQSWLPHKAGFVMRSVRQAPRLRALTPRSLPPDPHPVPSQLAALTCALGERPEYSETIDHVA